MWKSHAIQAESEENIINSGGSGDENRCLYAKVTQRACMELRELSRGIMLCDSAISSLMTDVRKNLEKGHKELTKLSISKAKKSKTLNKLDEYGFAVLHHATRYNRVEAVQDLLENDAHVNIRSSQDGLTPLHIAVRFGWDETTKILLQHGADPNIQSENGCTPLHQACKQGNKQIVSLLLNVRNVDCNIKDNSKMTPLHMAAIQGDGEVCQMLMDKGADYRYQADDLTTPLHAAVASGNNEAASVILKKALAENPNLGFISDVRDIDSNSILHLAALTNNNEIAEVILEHGASVNDTTSNMSTPLHLACAKGHMNMMKLLMEKKADVEARDSDGRTALLICVQFNQTNIITHLLDKGADIESRDFTNRTPLLAAAANGHTESVLILISKGADITAYDSSMKNCVHLAVENGNIKTLNLLLGNENCLENLNKTDIRERVPLHYAAMCDDVKVLHALLNKQKRFVFHDENQKTPLHLACENGRAEQAEALALASSSVNDRNDEGKTPLHIAASCGHRKVCSKLVSLGADVNIRDNNRWTPLMFAAKTGSTKTCSDLLSHKSSIDDVNNEGNSALLIATRSGQASVVKILLDRGASVTIRDNEGASLVEVAAKHGVYDVMMEICQHQRWKEVMEIKDNLAHPAMELLIQHFPNAATLIMNYCVQKAPNMNQSDPSYTVTYDFSLLDPGPDDPAGLKGHRYFGPLTMVHHNRQQLLEHPLTQELLDKKWTSFGRFVFFFNFMIYIIFTSFLTSFVVMERAGLTFEKSGNVTIDPTDVFRKEKHFVARFSYVIVLFAVLQLIKECIQMALQRVNYFKDLSNYVEWGLYSSTIIFLTPYTLSSPVVSMIYGNLMLPRNLWVSGVISIYLCYMNLVLCMRRFRVTGIYVTMYIQVVETICKVLSLFSLFVVAFALVFYAMFKEQIQFRTTGHAMLTVMAMMVGDLQYVDTFVVPPGQENAMSITAYCFCFIFLCIMSLAIMNLLIGLAVGDIDNIKRDATLKRLAMQVEFVAEIENKYPRFVTRRLYKPVLVTYPNTVTLRTRMKNEMFSMKVSGEKSSLIKTIEDEQERSLFLYNKIKKTQKQVKSLVHVIEMQNHLLRSLAKKIDPDFDSMSMVEKEFFQASNNLADYQEESANNDTDGIHTRQKH